MPTGVQYLESLGVRFFMDSSNFVTGAARVRLESDRTILGMEARIDALRVKIQRLSQQGPVTPESQARLERMQATVVNLEQQIIKTTATMYAFSAVAVGAPLLAMSSHAIKNFITLDEAVHKAMATMGDYQMKYKDVLMHASVQMSTGTPTHAADITGAFEEFSHAGFSIAEAGTLMDTAQKASVVSGMKLVDVVKIMTQAQRGLGVGFDSSEEKLRTFVKLADIITKGSQVAATSWEVFAKGLADPKLGNAARMMGMDPEDIGGFVLGMSQLGINSKNSARSGVGFSNFFRELGKSATQPQFAKVWQAQGMQPLNEYGNIKRPVELLMELQNRMRGMSDLGRLTLLNYGLGFNRMSDNLVQGLMNIDTHGNSAAAMIAFFTGELDKAGGTLDNVYNVRIQSAKLQTEIFKVNMSNLSTVLGYTFGPALSFVLTKLNDLTEAFLRLSPVYQQIIVVTALTLAFSMLAGSVFMLVKTLFQLTFMRAALSGLALPFTALWGALTYSIPLAAMLTSVLSGVATAIFAIDTFLVFASTSIIGILTGTVSWSAVLGTVLTTCSGLAIAISPVLAVILAIGVAVGLLYYLAPEALDSLWDSAKVGFGGLIGILSNFSENWKILCDFMGDSWGKTLAGMLGDMGTYVGSIFKFWSTAIQNETDELWYRLHRPVWKNQQEKLQYETVDAAKNMQWDYTLNRYWLRMDDNSLKMMPQNWNQFLANEKANNPKFSGIAQQRYETLERLANKPFGDRQVTGLPSFKTDLPKPPDYSKFTDLFDWRKIMDGLTPTLPDLGDMSGMRAHEFKEMPAHRFALGGAEGVPGLERDVKSGVDKLHGKLVDIEGAIKENTAVQKMGPEPKGSGTSRGHTTGKNPAHVNFGKHFPITNP